MKRRDFIRQALLYSGAIVLPLGQGAQAFQFHRNPPSDTRLVFVFLRGGMDGLNVVSPWKEDAYYEYRPSISIPAPGQEDGLLPLDEHFGLHPALAPLLPLWKQKQLAFIHACGLKGISRSHFEAQDILEKGGTRDDPHLNGWLNRLFGQLKEHDSPTNAVSISDNTPLILRGDIPVSTLSLSANPAAFTRNVDYYHQLEAAYLADGMLSENFRKGLEIRNEFNKTMTTEARMANNGAMDSSAFARSASRLAELMRASPTIRIGVLSVGGWDTHNHQGSTRGILAKRLAETASGLSNLALGLGQTFDNTLIVVMSEFGRTARENGSGGTDHGHGNVMWLLGGKLKGGKVHGAWPGISPEKLFEGRDLDITTDYRAPFKEIIQKHFGLGSSQIARIFPDSSQVKPTDWLL